MLLQGIAVPGHGTIRNHPTNPRLLAPSPCAAARRLRTLASLSAPEPDLAESPPATATARSRGLLLAILALALLVRLAHWWAVRGQPFFAQLVVDSREYDRWAQAIAAGDWLGSGAFFQAPLYPYLLGGLYALVGRSLDAVYLLQIIVGVCACAALYLAGRQAADERSGLFAAALAALYGPFLFYDVQVQKESLAASVVCFLLLAGERARRATGLRPWLGLGALLGVLALLRENALLLVPFLLPLAWRRGDGWRRFAARGATVGAGLVLVLLPVAARNLALGGGLLPTTFQGGVNFYIGNHPGADGTYIPLVPGLQVPELERREAVRLAERAVGHPLSAAEVSSYWLRRSLAWAAREPLAFARLQLRKLRLFWSFYEWPDSVDYYWVKTQSPALRLVPIEFGGLTLLAALGILLARRRLATLALPLLFTAGWTASVVAFFLFSRYRVPVVPALILLAAPALAEASRAGRTRRGAWLLAGCALALLLPRLVPYQPRLDLVHDNLARLAEEAGQPAEAAAHYRTALAASPDDLVATLGLGSLAARAGDLALAERLFAHGVALAPDSDDAASDLGGVYLAEGRLDLAQRELERALELDPQNPRALQNAALLHLRRGETAAARELVERLLALDPRNPAALRLERRIQGEAGAEPPPGGGRR